MDKQFLSRKDSMLNQHRFRASKPDFNTSRISNQRRTIVVSSLETRKPAVRVVKTFRMLHLALVPITDLCLLSAVSLSTRARSRNNSDQNKSVSRVKMHLLNLNKPNFRAQVSTNQRYPKSSLTIKRTSLCQNLPCL